MAGIRAELHDWISAEDIEKRFTVEEQKDLAFSLIGETYTEDKLAGILYLQEVLMPAGVRPTTPRNGCNKAIARSKKNNVGGF